MQRGGGNATSVSKLKYLFWGEHPEGGGDDLVVKKNGKLFFKRHEEISQLKMFNLNGSGTILINIYF